VIDYIGQSARRAGFISIPRFPLEFASGELLGRGKSSPDSRKLRGLLLTRDEGSQDPERTTEETKTKKEKKKKESPLEFNGQWSVMGPFEPSCKF